MLPKINRIKKKKDFDLIFKRGRGSKNDFLAIKTIQNDLGFNRAGFVVSQKISKKAVARNKIRRRLSEIMRADMANIKKGTDVVLVALPGIEKKDFKEIKEKIKDLLNKSKLISPS